ncbi:MAG: ROK family protein [Pseudomonadota bacterium]
MEIRTDPHRETRVGHLQRDESGLFARSANERRLLALLQRSDALPGVEIARHLGLSAQAVSVMTRKLEADGLIVRDDAVRGKVGKPQTPFRLAPDGAYSIGLRIGRRSADIVMVDFVGHTIGHGRTEYPFPAPEEIDGFARHMTDDLVGGLPTNRQNRVAGIGVGAPFELWNWLGAASAPSGSIEAWRDFNFEQAFSQWTDFPIFVGNDASLACQGEAMFGAGRGQPDFGYLYLGAFIGGGVYLNGRLFAGATGNAGAFGSLPVRDAHGNWGQLLEFASIHQLELAVGGGSGATAATIRPDAMWDAANPHLGSWIAETSHHIAYASMSVVASFDVPLIILDGSFPPAILERLVAETELELAKVDRRGVRVPNLVAGTLGSKAGALGAAYEPITNRLLE